MTDTTTVTDEGLRAADRREFGRFLENSFARTVDAQLGALEAARRLRLDMLEDLWAASSSADAGVVLATIARADSAIARLTRETGEAGAARDLGRDIARQADLAVALAILADEARRVEAVLVEAHLGLTRARKGT